MLIPLQPDKALGITMFKGVATCFYVYFLSPLSESINFLAVFFDWFLYTNPVLRKTCLFNSVVSASAYWSHSSKVLGGTGFV